MNDDTRDRRDEVLGHLVTIRYLLYPWKDTVLSESGFGGNRGVLHQVEWINILWDIWTL